MKTNPSEPINPVPDNALTDCGEGLTKREYFAAMAMQGLIASCNAGDAGGYFPDTKINSQKAVELADALIEQLNKQP